MVASPTYLYGLAAAVYVTTCLAAYDYATASVKVDAIVDTKVTTTADATFVNEQSIWRFGFKAGGNAISVKEFSITSNHGKLVQSRSWGGTE